MLWRRRLGLDRLLHIADRCALGPRHPHRGGELGLAAGPAQVEHQPTGHRLRDVGAVVLLDQRQRQVDTGRDTGRCPDLLRAAHEDRVRIDRNVWELRRQQAGERPVGGRGAAVEQPGLGGQEGAGADADHATGVAGGGSDPVDDLGVLPDLVDPEAAGQHHGVDGCSGSGSGSVTNSNPMPVLAGSPSMVATVT